MRLELYYFTTPEESQRLPDGWNDQNCTRNECKAVAQAAYEYRAKGNSVFFYEYDFAAFRVENPESQKMFNYFKISNPPALIFYDPDSKLAIAALKGNAITKPNILKVLDKFNEYESAGNVDGVFGYYRQDGTFVPLPDLLEELKSETGFSPIGFGLLDLSNLFGSWLPAWAWLLPAAFLGYKAFDTDNGTRRAVYGAGAAFFGLQFYLANKKKS